ncbi:MULTISPECIES: acetate/propionate family kinase [Paenalcaligenes]|uniref:Acetate kinase n=1 Tax=Paenalcaligenes hermetiae TaxID=1157987 RepID=A0ABP9LRV8_9BURK|nr:acetate/propionate family kinase [Paenalcaligenes sp.]
MSEKLIVINAGSSSLKFNVYQIPESGTLDVNDLSFLYGGQVSGIGTEIAHFKVKGALGQILEDRATAFEETKDLQAAQELLANWLTFRMDKPAIAVGHRIVHGGADMDDSAIITDEVLDYLDALAPLAPLHQHNNLAPVRVIREYWPQILQVACVDTAFHCHQDELYNYYALPKRYYEQGVRRYGFHGLSYQYISDYMAQHLPDLHKGRVIVAHLGSGSSACMIQDGKSVVSTMGFTALDGLPMSTRPGRLDAGVVLWWMQQRKKDADEIQDLLYNQSGMKGLSGISGDMRTLLASEDPQAKLAVDYYCFRTAESLAGLCVPTQGADGIVFTAGVGEHSPEIRARICEHLAWLGVKIDPELNAQGAQKISTPDSHISVWVIPTNEELVIAREALRHYALHQQSI